LRKLPVWMEDPRKGVPKGENVTVAHNIKFWMLLNQIESLELISGD